MSPQVEERVRAALALYGVKKAAREAGVGVSVAQRVKAEMEAKVA